MNTMPSVFNFNSAAVRTVVVDNDPWFSAADVCAVLGVKNHRDALQHLDDDEKGVVSNDTPGGIQKISIINESGLYSLVLRSRKPEAKPFIKWVTKEVLPAIRKTGQYVAKQYAANHGDSLTKDEADTIRDMLRNAAEKAPQEKQKAIMLQGWSKLKAHFGCSYREIPRHEFTEAVSLIARHITSGELIQSSNQEDFDFPDTSKRYLVGFVRGEKRIKEISDEACVMTMPQFLNALVEPNGLMVDIDDLSKFVVAATSKMRQISLYYQSKALKLA